MKYKALFIDLDGTILDTLKDVAVAVNYSLEKHNLPTHNLEEIRSYLGKGSNYLIHQAMNNQHEEIFDSVFDCYKKYYLKNFAVYTKPYPGTYQLLKDFHDQGGKIALVSNKPQDIAEELIDKFFPDIFDCLYGNRVDIKTKPDPTSAFMAMKDLNITNKKEILYVGDSLVDEQTALNAGFDYLLCNYGFAGKDEIINTHHQYINQIEEMRGYLF